MDTPRQLPKHIQHRITDRLDRLHKAGMPLTQRQPDGSYVKKHSDGRVEVLDLSVHDAAVLAARSKAANKIGPDDSKVDQQVFSDDL